MILSLGFSPCPNDTFIFDALINGKIDTGDMQFEPVLEDVQTLNQWALEGKLDITKLSYGVLPLVLHRYILLNSGSALGKGVGPLLIAGSSGSSLDVEGQLVAIPGKNTTAHLLFSLKYPQAQNKLFLRYDEIEEFVAQGKGLGVIIHENRFTYAAKGLQKITDLGDFWEQQNKVPIPLGGIVINRRFDLHTRQKVDKLIKESIEYAFAQYPELNDYIRNHAQEMSEEVMRKHIDLYVNEYSIGLGHAGKAAILKLIEVFSAVNNTELSQTDIFVE
jgi:1,4-dihydroxy-6-naphthoate synthase